MAARAIVLELAGISALSLLLFLFFSAGGNMKEDLNRFLTSVSTCPACPEVTFTSGMMSEPNNIKGLTENLIQSPVGDVQCTPPQRASEPKLQHFVYVYDLGHRYTTDVLALKPTWYDIQYDGDKRLTQALMESSTIRTTDPENATLFYVPFYAARFTMFYFKDLALDMANAINKTSEAWREILTQVRTDFPFFNRSNGADHFSVLTMDHGRCSSLTFLPSTLYGKMFFLQTNGDKLVRSNDIGNYRNMQTLGYNYGQQASPDYPSIPCYMADRDIVIPPVSFLPNEEIPLDAKNITALFRFRPDAFVRMSHHSHWVRKEIFDMYEKKNVAGWNFALKSPAQTDQEWRFAKFIVSPPGHSQWTSRPIKAIQSSSIAITFTRFNDEPWEDEIDYDAIRVNIDPDDVAGLEEKVEEVMGQEGRMEAMLKAISAIKVGGGG